MDPFVSIVYLTKDGGTLLGESLAVVCSQAVEFEYEVIAVDSGSTDGTLALLDATPSVTVYSIPPENFNFGETRDYGFSKARGEIIVTLSQDVVPVGSDWLRNIVAPFADDNVAVVQGSDIVPIDREVFYWYKNRLFYTTRDVIKWNKCYDGIGLSFTSCALRRSVWQKFPIGKVGMSEDKMFQKHISGKGYEIVFQTLAQTFHAHMFDVKSLATRCENEGMGWRYCGHDYSIIDMLADMFNYKRMISLMKGVFHGQIRLLAELLFPIIRPIYLYKGNHFTKKYVKSSEAI